MCVCVSIYIILFKDIGNKTLTLSSSSLVLYIGQPLGMMRIIDLSDSDCLIETPDFSATPNLEELVLTHCNSLLRIHKSVGKLKKLVKLRLDYCINLITLPSYLETSSLEEFILGGCMNLVKLPEFSRKLTSLVLLNVRSTGIKQIPSSIINLINLRYLDVSDCNMLKSFPELPTNLIICGSYCPPLKITRALEHLYDSRVFKVSHQTLHFLYTFFCLTILN